MNFKSFIGKKVTLTREAAFLAELEGIIVQVDKKKFNEWKFQIRIDSTDSRSWSVIGWFTREQFRINRKTKGGGKNEANRLKF